MVVNRDFLKATAFSALAYSVGVAFVLLITPDKYMGYATLPYISGVIAGAVMRTIFLKVMGE